MTTEWTMDMVTTLLMRFMSIGTISMITLKVLSPLLSAFSTGRSECSGIREKGWLDKQFEEIDFEASCKVATATSTISTASVEKVRLNKPQGRIIAITRQRLKDWQYENKPIFAPSWRLLKQYKGGYITYQEFRERYLNEMRHLYRNTTILRSFAEECMKEPVVLCCYCKEEKYCARAILKDILEKIISKLKGKVVYPVQQESHKTPKHEEVVEYQVRRF